MASRRLAQHLFCAGKFVIQRGACRRTEISYFAGIVDGRNGAAIYFEQSGCGHHYSGNAENQERGSKHRRQRQGPATRGAACGIAKTSLGPHANRVEPVKEVIRDQRSAKRRIVAAEELVNELSEIWKYGVGSKRNRLRHVGYGRVDRVGRYRIARFAAAGD